MCSYLCLRSCGGAVLGVLVRPDAAGGGGEDSEAVAEVLEGEDEEEEVGVLEEHEVGLAGTRGTGRQQHHMLFHTKQN